MSLMVTPDYRGREIQPRPHAVGTIGVWLFLAALTMLFGASLVGYIYIRLAGPNSMSQNTQPQPLHFPPLLWVSTVLVLGVSFTMHQAVQTIARERYRPFRFWLNLSLGLGCGFIAIQTPAMLSLLKVHEAMRASGMHVYGLVFTLILIHALHVIGGIVQLILVWVKAKRGLFDHEYFAPVRHAMMYWHFLDAVWVTMFLTFLLIG
jgi:heme/copper-type cytochrome/quinol oxidase subunit 3